MSHQAIRYCSSCGHIGEVPQRSSSAFETCCSKPSSSYIDYTVAIQARRGLLVANNAAAWSGALYSMASMVDAIRRGDL